MKHSLFPSCPSVSVAEFGYYSWVFCPRASQRKTATVKTATCVFVNKLRVRPSIINPSAVGLQALRLAWPTNSLFLRSAVLSVTVPLFLSLLRSLALLHRVSGCLSTSPGFRSPRWVALYHSRLSFTSRILIQHVSILLQSRVCGLFFLFYWVSVSLPCQWRRCHLQSLILFLVCSTTLKHWRSQQRWSSDSVPLTFIHFMDRFFLS